MSSPASAADPREIRRIGEDGTSFWIRRLDVLVGDPWTVTADGVTIAGPTTFKRALEGLDAVCPSSPDPACR